MLGCYGIDGRLWPLRSSSPVVPHRIDRFAMTTFRDVLAQLRAADLTHLAPRLVDQGVRNIDQMNGLTPEQVLAVAPEQRDLEAFCRFLGRSIPKRTTEIRTRGRRDLPVVTSSTRGSIIGALEAAAPAVQQEAIQNLVRDQYANTTRNTRDSRWNLWTRLATSWKLPPLPITAELVQAIASTLKRGRYHSSAQVFSMARQQHVAHTGCRLSADIEQPAGPGPINAQGRIHCRRPRSHNGQLQYTTTSRRPLGRVPLRLCPRDSHLLLVDASGRRSSGSSVLRCLVRNHLLWQVGVLHAPLSQNRHNWDVYYTVAPMHMFRQLGGPLSIPCFGHVHPTQSSPGRRQE